MMTTRPLVVLCTAWIAGSTYAALLPGSAFWFVWWGIVIWMVWFAVLTMALSCNSPLFGNILSHNRVSFKRLSPPAVMSLYRSSQGVSELSSPLQLLAAALRTLLCMMFVFVIAAAYWHWNDERNTSGLPQLLALADADMTGQRAEVTGVIAGNIDIDGDRVRFPLELYQLQPFESALSESGTALSYRDGSERDVSKTTTLSGTDTPNINALKVAGSGTDTPNINALNLAIPELDAPKITISETSPSNTNAFKLDRPETNDSKLATSFAGNISAHNRQPLMLNKRETIIIQLKLAQQQELQRAHAWQRGDRIVVTGSWKQPGGARNFGTFDYRQYLRTQHIHWILEAAGADALRPADIQLSVWSDKQLSLLRWNDDLRQRLGVQIERIFWQADQGYMKGLLIGNADDIDPESFAAFSRLGLTHILAISGLHIAIYVGLLLWLLQRIRLTKQSACLIVMVVLPFYVLLTGASPSAIRAGLMGMIGLYLASRGRLKDGLHLLCLVGWMMLLYEPYYLLDVSFQLSFAVTAGLIIYVPLLHVLLNRLPARIGAAVAVTLVAQLISFPLTIYYFNQFSLLSFVANFALVPVSGLLVLPVGTLALAISYVWLPAGVWIGSSVSWLNRWCFRLVEWFDAMPGMLTIWAAPSWWLLLVYYVLLYIALRYMRDMQQWLEQHANDPLYTHIKLDASGRNFSMPMSDREAGNDATDDYAIFQMNISSPTHILSADAEYKGNPANLHSAGTETFVETDRFAETGTDKFAKVGMFVTADTMSTSASMAGRAIPVWKLYIRRGLHWQLAWTRRKLWSLPVMLLALSLLLGYWYDAPHHHGDGIVQFLDIGQGDSILITTPTGKHILVDGGGTINFRSAGQAWRQRKQPYEVGNKLIVPLLKQRGVHTLDAVIATHWDQDHVGGLAAVIEAIPVRRWIFNGTMPDNHQRDDMIRSLLDRHIPLVAPTASMTMQPDPYTRLDFIAPTALAAQSIAIGEPAANQAATLSQSSLPTAALLPLPIQEDQNSYSIVFMLTLYGRHILFTGDADTMEEQSILYDLREQYGKQAVSANDASVLMEADGTGTYQAQDRLQHTASLLALTPPIDVLKVGHHGSKSSSSAEWLAYWQPRVSIISVGENNRYGHPKAEVLDRLAAVHSAVARTDQQGEIQLRIAPSGEMKWRSMWGAFRQAQ
ncbi:ComEC/Rec2 family competence protein [Paenibacillus sp. SGZ-1009]|uniref:ComEC/Rec2 family competence protein n=1 Tax=Paenibacillus campi TaxID=3106031 RepID=UPI002AFF0AB1|nr:ComEC/Rec2 family competence protein [Paenibacillus sp. SGZ-1009]